MVSELFSKTTIISEYLTVKAPVSGHPWEAQKCPQLELAAKRNVSNLQSLYELEFKQGFVKAAVSRAVHLRECVNTEFV